jgi:hypothetical protein
MATNRAESRSHEGHYAATHTVDLAAAFHFIGSGKYQL